MTELTDKQLMAEAAKGNLDTLGVLFERHHKHVFNFLHKMSGDRMLSEDLTQDVFYKLMRYRTSYNNGNFTSWLFTIARNRLNTHYTRNKENHDDIEKQAYRLAAKEEDQTETYTHLHKALNTLEDSDRELLVLSKLQGIKYNELAEILGSTPGALKTRANRALNKLKIVYFENI